MTSQRITASLRKWFRNPTVILYAVGTTITLLASAYGAKFIAPNGQSVFVLLVVALAASIAIMIPVEALPSAALILYVLLPQQAVGFVRGAAPAAVLLAIWAFRKIGQRGRHPADKWTSLTRLGTLIVAAWSGILLVTTESSENRTASVWWLLAFTLSLVIPGLINDTTTETRLLWRLWPFLTMLIATYVVLEFAIQSNFLYDMVYSAVGRPVDQQWSIYRSHGPFGHPLYAATFFATSAAAALGRHIVGYRGSYLWFVASCVGLLTTVSRGALVALVVAAAGMVLIAALSNRRHADLTPLVLQLIFGSLLVALSGFLQMRSGSTEATSSAVARSDAVTGALELARDTDWRGTGAGSSDRVFEALVTSDYPIESSPLQIAVSLGLAGLIGFALIITGTFGAAVMRRSIPIVGALVAFLISISVYNAIDSVLPLMAFLGIIAIMARSEDTQGESDLDGPGTEVNQIEMRFISRV